MQEAIYFEPIVKKRYGADRDFASMDFPFPKTFRRERSGTLASHPNGTTRVESGRSSVSIWKSCGQTTLKSSAWRRIPISRSC